MNIKTDMINSVQSSLKSHLCKPLQKKVTINFLGRRPRPSSRTIFSLKSTEFILKHSRRLAFNCLQKLVKLPYCINSFVCTVFTVLYVLFLQYCMYCFYSFVCTVFTLLCVLFLQYCVCLLYTSDAADE